MEKITNLCPDRPLHGIEASRKIERAAQVRLPPYTLMQRAGEASARLALALAPHAPCFWVFSGPGNNGGDGLEAARVLHLSGRCVQVFLAADPARLPADAQIALARAHHAGLFLRDTLPGAKELEGSLLIDALLGLGLRDGQPPLPAPLARGLELLRGHAGPILAVDTPSGLNADTGQGLPWTARATATLSLLTLKPGLFTSQGRDFSGEIWWDDLLAPTHEEPTAWLGSNATPPHRRHHQHKGSFGDLTIIGGAPGMTGAALLAGRAAHAAGAGRIYLSLLGEGKDDSGLGDASSRRVDIVNPALMFSHASAEARSLWSGHTLVVGCGGGQEVASILPHALQLAARLIIDADGLNAIAKSKALRTQLLQRGDRGLPTILTPHPLEAARLLGCTADAAQGDRIAAAQRLAQELASVVVLKGSGTVIATPNTTPFINLPGNAALASPGTGDVLAGWMGGWWAQSPEMPPQELARQAVAWHGLAAEPEQSGPLLATELVDRMHRAVQAGLSGNERSGR